MRSSLSDVDCMRFPRGTQYFGTINHAEDGKPCEKWNESLLVLIAPEKVTKFGSESYCRNPEGLMETPWCFTNVTYFSKCDIPFCSKFVASYSKSVPVINDICISLQLIAGIGLLYKLIIVCKCVFILFMIDFIFLDSRRSCIWWHLFRVLTCWYLDLHLDIVYRMFCTGKIAVVS